MQRKQKENSVVHLVIRVVIGLLTPVTILAFF